MPEIILGGVSAGAVQNRKKPSAADAGRALAVVMRGRSVLDQEILGLLFGVEHVEFTLAEHRHRHQDDLVEPAHTDHRGLFHVRLIALGQLLESADDVIVELAAPGDGP